MWTCGRFDKASPITMACCKSLLPGSQPVIFEDSSQTVYLEEREHYMYVVCGFLHRVEGVP
jgi:proline iminopeptidase